jgi:hypothetical protein
VNVGASNSNPVQGISVQILNGTGSNVLSDVTNSLGRTSTVKVLHYSNIGGTAKTFNYTVNYVFSDRSGQNVYVLPSTNYALPYYMSFTIKLGNTLWSNLVVFVMTMVFAIFLILQIIAIKDAKDIVGSIIMLMITIGVMIAFLMILIYLTYTW